MAKKQPYESLVQTPSHLRIDEARPRVEHALDILRSGGTVCIVEDVADGQAVFAAQLGELANTDAVNLLVQQAGGILAVTVDDERADALQLAELPRRRAPEWMPRYAVSIEAAKGVSTGISAADRSKTIQTVADPDTLADGLVRPGHVMPIRIAPLGSLRRPYGPEAAHDLAVLAGRSCGAVISHVIEGNDELRPDRAEAFSQSHGWPLLRVSDVIVYRATHDILVRVISEATLETQHGRFQVRLYENDLDQSSHVALLRDDGGGPSRSSEPLVRIHSQCLTGDVLGSLRCDCGEQLQHSLARVAEAGHGAVVYLSQEGRGIGLTNKIRAYALQDGGSDTVDANVQLGFPPDQRDYAVAGQILRQMDMTRIRLMTNNPEKLTAMARLGIEITERVAIEAEPSEANRRYLQTKRDRMGHLLERLN